MRRLLFLFLSLASLVAAPAAQARTIFDAGNLGDDAVTVPMGHLPTWLQVAGTASISIYATDSGSQLASSNKLKPYTFLEVLGGGTARLHVDVYDENGNSSLRGWVDPDHILPSAPGTNWLVSATSMALYRSADSASDPLRTIDRFVPLQVLDGPVHNMIQVRVYRLDFTVLDQGWVDATNTGRALAPQTHVPSPTPDRSLALKALSPANQQQAFLADTSRAARAAAPTTGVPASITVAQAILESDWGRSSLSQSANNFFGMKAMGRIGSDGVVWLPTSEYDADGELYDTVSAFRAYKSLTDSLLDHNRLLATAGRYSSAMSVAADPKQFAVELYQDGYSTDPDYPDKLIALMDRYNLYRLDV